MDMAGSPSVLELSGAAGALAPVEDGALGPADVTIDARAANALALESANLSDLEFAVVDEGTLDQSRGWLIRAGLVVWGAGVIAMAVISAIRFAACWRTLRRSPVETHPELDSLVAQLAKSLRVRRATRLLVTDSRIGPAVIGLRRPTILLPACVVRGRAAAELEPIVAHELIHIRRGDLWVGLLQTVAQSLWWFHPLVWLAGRMITREAERCCDEEVIGELRCEPSRYARSLLGVLEWKRILIPAPAVPGVRAVEITSRRLERIMTLGQGCRRRTPWWCWGTMLVVAALALPGSPLQMTATEPDEKPSSDTSTIPLHADRVTATPTPDAKPATPPEPVIFPEERGGAYDASKRPDNGKPLQVWEMADLLKTVEKQLGVDRVAAKRILWLRLVNAQRDLSKLPPMITDGAEFNAKGADKDEEPDGVPYWQGDTLVLSQHPLRRKRSEEALAEMRKFGFEEVEIEVRFVTAPLNIFTDVSDAWTTLPMKSTSDAAAGLNGERSLQPNGAASGVASFAIEKNLPVILEVLENKRAEQLIDSAQGVRRANVLQAPKVRLGNGQTAAVMDCTQTPFVVGFKEKQPQISVVSEGTTVRARPVLDGKKAHVDFEVVFSGIRNVEEVKVRGPDGVQTTIQSPEVAQSRVAATVDVPLGQTALIGGLKDVRDPKSKASMAVLLTVRKAPMEKATIGHIRMLGADKSKVTLAKHHGLRVGDPINSTVVEQARAKLETWYHAKAYANATVTAVEGLKPGDTGVTFVINEGDKQTVTQVEFQGNTIAEDGVLRTKVHPKKPVVWLFKQELNDTRVDEDVRRLEEYYRGLGFFKARVSRELHAHKDGESVDVKFIIDEGPRYAVQKVSIVGNTKLDEKSLAEKLKLKQGEFFDQQKLKRDIAALQDEYTQAGHGPVVVASRTDLFEEPGKLDLVYRITEDAGSKTGDASQTSIDNGQSANKSKVPTHPILGPVTSGGVTAKALDPPSQDDVLTAVQKARAASNKGPLRTETQRENVRMTIEPIATYTDPPRVYPLIGPAQLHHAHYKCTIIYNETAKQGGPLPHTSAKKAAQEVVYVDHNHFHMVDEGARNEQKRATAGTEVKQASHEERSGAIFTVTYAVADLIMPFPNPVTITPTKDVKPLPQGIADFQPLLDLITSTVAPESWNQSGGECKVTTFPNGLSLVVSQTEKGHAEISKLFQKLRENLDKQVVLDCRTIDDPAELFRLMKSDEKTPKKTGLAMLPPAIAAQAHKMAEAKGGRNYKLTVFNGQQLKLPMLQEVRDGKAGFLTIQALISKDKQSAGLRIADSREFSRQPWQQEEMTVLECGTLLIDLTRFHLSTDLGVPLPAKDGAEPKPFYVLITPRVIDASGVKPKDKKPGGAASDTKKSGKSTPPKAVPVLLTDEDQRQLGAGVQVTKVLYRPNEEFASLALGPVETIVSTRLDPNVDVIAEARRRGTILAVVRMNADLGH
jgi:beta-lactamase regulating signal transducer with metallopeptidase domain